MCFEPSPFSVAQRYFDSLLRTAKNKFDDFFFLLHLRDPPGARVRGWIPGAPLGWPLRVVYAYKDHLCKCSFPHLSLVLFCYWTFPSSWSGIILTASPALCTIHCHSTMKTSRPFVAISLILSVSAAAIFQNDHSHNISAGQGNNNDTSLRLGQGNRESNVTVILFLKCRCLNLIVLFFLERCLQLYVG